MKATILNDQFASVFNMEDNSTMPDLPPCPYQPMPDIDIHQNGVEKLL